MNDQVNSVQFADYNLPKISCDQTVGVSGYLSNLTGIWCYYYYYCYYYEQYIFCWHNTVLQSTKNSFTPKKIIVANYRTIGTEFS